MENNSWNYLCSLDGSTPQLHFFLPQFPDFLWILGIPDKQGLGLVFKLLQQSQNSHFGSFFSVYMELKMQNFPFPPTLGIVPSQKCSELSWDHSFPPKFPPQNLGIIDKPHKLKKKKPKTQLCSCSDRAKLQIHGGFPPPKKKNSWSLFRI